MKVWIGIDNGVSGSVAMISDNGSSIYFKTPVRLCLNYTKAKQFLDRVWVEALYNMLSHHIDPGDQALCLIERPLVNPGRWKATMSAMRAFEATLIVLELLKIRYEFCDSKEWQKVLLPKDLEKEELKFASLEVGKRLYPRMDWTKWKDADGLLIAHYCKKMNP